MKPIKQSNDKLHQQRTDLSNTNSEVNNIYQEGSNNNNNNNTLFNHATFRSEKRSLKHVRAKTMYTINTIRAWKSE